MTYEIVQVPTRNVDKAITNRQFKFANTLIISMIRIPQEDLTFIRVLGKGGCGEVYLAEYLMLWWDGFKLEDKEGRARNVVNEYLKFWKNW